MLRIFCVIFRSMFDRVKKNVYFCIEILNGINNARNHTANASSSASSPRLAYLHITNEYN